MIVPPPTVHDAYVSDLTDVAHRWLAQRSIDGGNPFQDAEAMAEHRRVTVELVRHFTSTGDRVLDAGCAMGDTLAGLDHLERYGIDIVPDYFDEALANGIQVEVGDLERMPYEDGTFDAVLATDVLEHVLDLNAVLRECLRVLAPGGHLIVRTPDSEDLSGYLDLPWRFVHLRNFDAPGMVLLLDRVFGCEVVHIGRSTWGTTRELHAVGRKR